MSLGDGSMMGSGTLGQSFSIDITCKNDMCGQFFPSEDVETDDWGMYTFKCTNCGFESEFEEPEFDPPNDRMDLDD